MSNRPSASAASFIKSIRRSFSKLRHTKKTSSASSSCSQPGKIQEKKLLILDLDETLVHHSESFAESYALSCSMEGSTYYFNLRPFAREFLERVSQLFDVVVFTANRKLYADPVVDFLDPEGKLIVGRYYHDSGATLRDGYVKDLSIFKVDLARVVLVDNCPANFRLQKNNGIPIVSWFFDPQDEELSKLVPFLERLAAADDVRPIIAEKFTRRYVYARPSGKRCFVVPSEGTTISRLRNGSILHLFPSALPNGPAQSCTILLSLGLRLKQYMWFLVLNEDGSLTTSDDPLILFGCLSHELVLKSDLKPGSFLRFTIGEDGMSFVDGKLEKADLYTEIGEGFYSWSHKASPWYILS